MTVRISATDWYEGGLTADDAVLVAAGVRGGRRGSDRRVDRSGDARREAGLRPVVPDAVRRPDPQRRSRSRRSPSASISSYDDVNSILLAGRADLCALARRTSTTPTGPSTRRSSRSTPAQARPGRTPGRPGAGSRRPAEPTGRSHAWSYPRGRTGHPPPALATRRVKPMTTSSTSTLTAEERAFVERTLQTARAWFPSSWGRVRKAASTGRSWRRWARSACSAGCSAAIAEAPPQDAAALQLCLLRETIAAVSAEAETALALQGLGSYPDPAVRHSRDRRALDAGCGAGKVVAAFALTEPDAGSDAAALALRAEPRRRRLAPAAVRRSGSPTRPRPTSTRSSPAPPRTPAPGA